MCVLLLGPSAPPSGATADGMSTSITVQWGTVPCADQNGPITGYSVRYGEMGSGSTQTETATGNEAVISGLQGSTNYTVEVAAETSVGRGDYSEPIIVTTDSKTHTASMAHVEKAILAVIPFCNHMYIRLDHPFPLSAAISATVVSAMPTSILIRWSVIDSVEPPSGYNISYSNTENTDCFTISETVSITSDGRNGSYNIEGLQEGTEYFITVRLWRDGTISDMDTVKHSTADAGELLFSFIRSLFMQGPDFPAPTAPPSNVNVTDVTSSTITVQWGMVPCIHQNGPITGYSVRYGVMGSSEREIEEVVGDQRTATISELAAATVYEYEVAGITTADTGVYSDTMTTLTQGIYI